MIGAHKFLRGFRSVWRSVVLTVDVGLFSLLLLTKAKRRLRFCKMFLSGGESEGNLISEV